MKIRTYGDYLYFTIDKEDRVLFPPNSVGVFTFRKNHLLKPPERRIKATIRTLTDYLILNTLINGPIKLNREILGSMDSELYDMLALCCIRKSEEPVSPDPAYFTPEPLSTNELKKTLKKISETRRSLEED